MSYPKTFACFFAIGFIALFHHDVFSQTPYYQGKTITILRGGSPGGTRDMQARALIPFLKKYIPGEPTIIIENMPGAAGRKAANHIFSTVKPDGLTIGAGLVVGPILSLAGTQYDLDIALARGEVDVRANGADTIFQRNRDMLEKGKVDIHATITIPKGNFDARLPKMPELETFAKNDRERQLVNLFRTFLYPRWPYILPPNTPAEVVTILRGAMAKAFKDPEFRKEYQKLLALDPTPLTGEEVEVAIRELPRDSETVALYKKMADHGPLPPR